MQLLCGQICYTVYSRFRANPRCVLHGLQAWYTCGDLSFRIEKERLESSLTNQRNERLPEVVALCANQKEMARTVTLKAGKQSVQVFAANLLQHTGERFLKQLLQTPDVHGCATISLQESSVPALVKAFQMLNHEGTPGRVSGPEYLNLMLTLSSCNAWSALKALNSCLVLQTMVRGSNSECRYTAEEIPAQLLKGSLEIMTLFLPGTKTS